MKHRLSLAAITLVAVLGYFFAHPVFYVPKEYSSFLDVSTKDSIYQCCKGWYGRIPFFAVGMEVIEADERAVTVKTYYFPWGHSITSLSEDGFNQEQKITF